MKWITLIALCASLNLFAEVTMVKTPVQSELDKAAKKEGWTFSYKERPQTFATGLVKNGAKYAQHPLMDFFLKDQKVSKRFLLSSLATLNPVYDQGQCGSCVYNAVNGTWIDTMAVRGLSVPSLSRQELMDCWARDWRCSGSYFEKVAAGLVEAKQLHSESDYKYTASNGTCRKVNGPLYGKIESYKVIDNSHKSVFTALNNYYAVAVTIGADGRWGSYSGGIYNACSNAGTNHEIEMVGYDCETSVDADGNCVFDSKGNLPAGVGLGLFKNSWAESYGEKGYVWMKLTSKSGSRCNNVMEETGILEVGIDPKPACEPQAKADAGPERSLIVE